MSADAPAGPTLVIDAASARRVASVSADAPAGPTLVIDAASARGLAAVVLGDAVLVERVWTLETTYSRELLGAVDAALEGAGVLRTDLAAIVVDVGPGGYGSLRAAVATAQGLALGLDVPLAPVGRLEADAAPHLDASRPVVAVHEAGRAGLAWAAYASAGGSATPAVLVAPRLDSAADCVAAAPPGARWCGELGEELRAALAARGRTLLEVDAALNHRRAIDFAQLARAHEAFGDPAAVDVHYLRAPSITRPRP